MTDAVTAWIEAAKGAVERSIGQLFDEFLEHPFTHRREHSLHVDLYQSLIQQPELKGHHPIGSTGHKTRLVHKEWPTTVPATLRNSTKRLQSYDIGIVSPIDLANVPSTKAFAVGKPPARIAVELSLDYSLSHMEGDIKKFERNMDELEATSWAPVAYLVHFTRVATGHSQKVEDLLRETVEKKKINAVFAQLDQKTNDWKVWRPGATDFEVIPAV